MSKECVWGFNKGMWMPVVGGAEFGWGGARNHWDAEPNVEHLWGRARDIRFPCYLWCQRGQGKNVGDNSLTQDWGNEHENDQIPKRVSWWNLLMFMTDGCSAGRGRQWNDAGCQLVRALFSSPSISWVWLCCGSRAQGGCFAFAKTFLMLWLLVSVRWYPSSSG